MQDNLTVIDWYLKSRREDIVNRLLATDELQHKCQICDGHVGDNVSVDGAGRDYQLPPGKRDGQLVEVNNGGLAACSGATSGMQCG